MATCMHCGKEIGDTRFCPHCGVRQQPGAAPAAGSAPQAAPVQQTAPAPRMGWHKWMIYFVLWAHAVMCVGQAVPCFAYASQAGELLLLGAAYLALAAVAVWVRFQLAQLRRGATTKLMVYLLCYGAFIVVLSAMQGAINDIAPGLLPIIAYIIYNWRYYAERKALFVN